MNRSKTYIVSSVTLFVIAISLIVFVGLSSISTSIQEILMVIAGIIVISALVSFQRFLEQEDLDSYKQVKYQRDYYGSANKQLAQAKFLIGEDFPGKSLGLIEVSIDGNYYDYTSLILESKNLKIVLNEGRSWVSRNLNLLRERFKNPNMETVFYLLHPDSPMLTVLARKVNSTPDDQRSKIADTIRLLNENKCPETKLRIYGHFLYNPYSLFLSEDFAIVVPYFISRARKTLNLFRFQDIDDAYCHHKELQLDLKELQNDSEDISHYTLNYDQSGKDFISKNPVVIDIKPNVPNELL